MQITRTALPNGKFRYEVDGEVHTKAANKQYNFASVYRHEVLSDWDRECGRQVGDLIVFLHTRYDLAAKGHAQANKIVQNGDWSRVGRVVEIFDN